MPRSLPAGVLALLLLIPGRAHACPACYLPGSLADSVRSARTIYMGQVVRALELDRAEVKVVRVLRGPLKKDQLVQTPVPDARGRIGSVLLVIHPADWPRLSPPLGPEFEDEVRFLMRRRPRITTLAEAIRRVQGVSHVTSAMGLQYIRRHRKGATDLLIEEIERVKSLIFSGQRTFRDEQRLEMLVRALLGEVDAGSRAYVLREVQGFLGHGWRGLDKQTIPDLPDVRGLFLEWLLSSTQEGRLRGEVRQRVESAYARLGGEGIACAVYALAHSRTSSPASFKPLGRAEQTEALATGLYLAGNPRARDLPRAESRALLKRARALTRSAVLRDAIDGALEAQ